jgi:hypothetical protein
MEIFFGSIRQVHVLGVDSASKNEYQDIPGGKGWPMRRGDDLNTFMCRVSRNLGASNSWNPQGLSRAVMGILYGYLLTMLNYIIVNCVLSGETSGQ